ncbi:MAG: hypothetical protein LBP91_04800 [Coriobacteriales bacterium]|jgi:hypothetical protein|nr:hypothetical protein [Coriobacteriales bacterium]
MDILNLILSYTPVALAESDDGSGTALIALLVLMLSGFVFYGVMYTRYRNADKRHFHERETSASIANLQSADTFIKARKGLSNAKMHNANHTRVDGALNKGAGGIKLDLPPKK